VALLIELLLSDIPIVIVTNLFGRLYSYNSL